jgi:hypothetical protein
MQNTRGRRRKACSPVLVTAHGLKTLQWIKTHTQRKHRRLRVFLLTLRHIYYLLNYVPCDA